MINDIVRHHELKKNFKQVNKITAEKEFNQGITVYLLSSNMQFNNIWMQPCPINSCDQDSFKNNINSYSYYNCTNETGKYIHYFIEVKSNIITRKD